MDLFLLLWPGDWNKQLQQMNEAIDREYKKKSKHKHSVRQIKPVSPYEFFVFLGIIIISGAVGKGGKALFEKESDRLKDGVYRLSPVIDLSPHMSMRRFEDIKSYFPQAFAALKVYCCPEMKSSKQPRNCYKEHILEAHPSFKMN
jgi:hypothetical protein